MGVKSVLDGVSDGLPTGVSRTESVVVWGGVEREERLK